MNSKKFNLIMIGLTAFTSLAIFGALFTANSLLKSQSKKLYDLKLKSQVLSQQQVTLLNAKKDIAKYSELNREARVIVPQDKDQAQVVREVVKLAKDAGVNISSIQFTSSTLGNAKLPTSSSTAGGDSSSTATTSTKAPPITQTEQVKGIKGVYVLPITIFVQEDPVDYPNLIKFLGNLEQNRRTAQVVNINIAPVPNNLNKVNFQLTLNAYLKP